MLLLRALLLWSVISIHVVGGAALFRRFFPRESPWFGFLVPGLALVVVINFIEHLVALPSLLWLLPFSSLVALWALTHPPLRWNGLRLPASIFLGSFAFTLVLRAITPDIVHVRDGVGDLSLMTSFCMGDKVPPPLVLYPPLLLAQYYTFSQYAASVLTRLLGIDVGTGFNLSAALISAFECLLAAAVAWRVSRGKVWITVLAPVLLECGHNGALSYFWLTRHDFEPDWARSLFLAMDDPANHNPLWKYFAASNWDNANNWNELKPPGTWSWIGSLHSTCGGQFLVLFFIWCLTELLRRRPSNWPWIGLGAIPLLTIVTSTWALPLECLFLIGALFWVWYLRLAPQNFRFVLLTLGFVLALLTPVLSDFLTTNGVPVQHWTGPDERTQLFEFLFLWWPLLLPWLALIFVWPRLSPAVKTVIVVLPVALIAMEFYTVGGRPDYTDKLWGYTYGAGWITLFPQLCRRGWVFRGLAAIIAISCFISFAAWSQFTWRIAKADDFLHLEGDSSLRDDPAMGKVLEGLAQIKRKTVITGKPEWLFALSPILVDLTGNRTYVNSDYFCDVLEGEKTYGQAGQRKSEVDDLYDGKCADPLGFLMSHDITALVIYPPDNIPDDVVARLKTQLAPSYEYEDFRSGDPNAGIFLYHPKMAGPAAPPLNSADATTQK